MNKKLIIFSFALVLIFGLAGGFYVFTPSSPVLEDVGCYGPVQIGFNETHFRNTCEYIKNKVGIE